ncbi:MAG: succinylglutamate desuccinylase [bacterium]|nr:succinylglutamate desuccinylase [bacterium]
MKRETLIGLIYLIVCLLFTALGGYPLYLQRQHHPIPVEKVFGKRHMLSDWASWLKGSRGDTDVFILEGSESGGAILILGGTHPDEPASFVSSLIALNTIQVEKGRVFIIPRANASGFTATEPGEGHPAFYTIPLPNGNQMKIQFGSRLTNPLDQWPTPDVQPHKPSGQLLSVKDLRNLNRCFPGDSCGLFTERVAAGITKLIRDEKIGLTIDLHEASLEYPVINALVAHEKGLEIASEALLELEMEDLHYSFEPSPKKLRGLTHRELGDHTETVPFLIETANVAQGRLRGRTTHEMITKGIDAAYFKAVATGLLKVPYDQNGIPLEVRCGRHLSAVIQLTHAYNLAHPSEKILFTGLPTYTELTQSSVGEYLK